MILLDKCRLIVNDGKYVIEGIDTQNNQSFRKEIPATMVDLPTIRRVLATLPDAPVSVDH